MRAKDKGVVYILMDCFGNPREVFTNRDNAQKWLELNQKAYAKGNVTFVIKSSILNTKDQL